MGYAAKDRMFRERAAERARHRRLLRIDILNERIDQAERAARFDDLLERWFAAKEAAMQRLSEAPIWLPSSHVKTWRNALDAIKLTGDTSAIDLEHLRSKIRDYQRQTSLPDLRLDRPQPPAALRGWNPALRRRLLDPPPWQSTLWLNPDRPLEDQFEMLSVETSFFANLVEALNSLAALRQRFEAD